MPVIKFTNVKREIEVPAGTNLRQAAIQAGVNVHQGLNGFGADLNKVINCHGFSQCGTCRVKILTGMENASRMGIVEKCRFKVPVPTPITPGGVDPVPCMAFIGNEETMRLSCQATVHGDMEVEVGPPLDLFGENFFS